MCGVDPYGPSALMESRQVSFPESLVDWEMWVARDLVIPSWMRRMKWSVWPSCEAGLGTLAMEKGCDWPYSHGLVRSSWPQNDM